MSDGKEISLTELLTEIGDDNITFQVLTHNLDGNQQLLNRGKNLRVSFLTAPANLPLADILHNRPTQREAFVVWMDRTALNDAMARLKERKGS